MPGTIEIGVPIEKMEVQRERVCKDKPLMEAAEMYGGSYSAHSTPLYLQYNKAVPQGLPVSPLEF